ncbi:MAG: rod shape-determining protein MreC [Steroidobacteraceae bacterium]
MSFGSPSDRPLYDRGPSAGLRFAVYALLALVLMYLDQRGRWTSQLRYGLQALAYPVQTAVNSPASMWRWLTESLQSRSALRTENDELREALRTAQLAALRADGLERENVELRGLKAALPPLIKKWQLAEVIGVDSNPSRQRVVINHGASSGVFNNQAVIDAQGVLGQVVSVGPLSAEVILITDPESAIPVQVLRNGVRTIAVGSGISGELLLPYLATNSDIRSGDLLLSSGLGGVYPSGYPVARVTGVVRDAKQALAQVHAQPIAGIAASREVLLVEFTPEHPAAPVAQPAAPLTRPTTTPALDNNKDDE